MCDLESTRVSMFNIFLEGTKKHCLFSERSRQANILVFIAQQIGVVTDGRANRERKRHSDQSWQRNRAENQSEFRYSAWGHGSVGGLLML